MTKIRKLFIFIAFIFVLTLSSCVVPNRHYFVVTNEVTNKVVDYTNISITEFENAIKETTKAVEKSVITINLKVPSIVDFNGQSVVSEDTIVHGSGVIYKRVELPDKQGFLYYVVTNSHVLLDQTEEVIPYVYDGFEDVEMKASIIGCDPKMDIGVITFESTRFYDYVEFGDSDKLEKGSFVIAIGSPKGPEFYATVTQGVISGTLRYDGSDTDDDGIEDFVTPYVQHDAAINPGNSGGGLFTIDGKLVGINSMKFISTTGNGVENFNFAIPSNVVKNIVENYLEKHIKITRPRLGITSVEVRELTPLKLQSNDLKPIPEEIYNGETPYGLYVTNPVSPNCSFSNCGIDMHDILLEFDGIKINSMTPIAGTINSLSKYLVGDEVSIKYYDRSENVIKTAIVTLVSPE